MRQRLVCFRAHGWVCGVGRGWVCLPGSGETPGRHTSATTMRGLRRVRSPRSARRSPVGEVFDDTLCTAHPFTPTVPAHHASCSSRWSGASPPSRRHGRRPSPSPSSGASARAPRGQVAPRSGECDHFLSAGSGCARGAPVRAVWRVRVGRAARSARARRTVVSLLPSPPRALAGAGRRTRRRAGRARLRPRRRPRRRRGQRARSTRPRTRRS